MNRFRWYVVCTFVFAVRMLSIYKIDVRDKGGNLLNSLGVKDTYTTHLIIQLSENVFRECFASLVPSS